MDDQYSAFIRVAEQFVHNDDEKTHYLILPLK